jgi:hypothetical protein
MDKKYLLTYFYTSYKGNSAEGFGWFETEEEMKEWVEKYKRILDNFILVEAFKIIEAEGINLE